MKSGYLEQLRNLDIVGIHLLPTIFNLLGLYGGLTKAFKLGIWAVDEYYIDSQSSRTIVSVRRFTDECVVYDPETSPSLQVLSAHLYYRALLVVPSLIRTWLLDCKDRTLSKAVTSYTSAHFSPVLLDAALALVPGADLASDDLTIKIAKATHEVTASYMVDEHQLELTLRLPADWPLHGIEVRDEKRVGVQEERWRAWVLGVFALAQVCVTAVRVWGC